MSRARKHVPPVLIRITHSSMLAWRELESQKPPTRPGNLLLCDLFELRVFPDLVIGEPGPLPPEIRAAVVEALTEGLVAAYRRQKNDLASQGRASTSCQQGGSPI